MRHTLYILLLLPLPLSLHAQRMEAERSVIDCGQVRFGHEVTADFVIRNGGDRSLTIDEVRTDCGCTTTEYPRTAVAKGKTFRVAATYDAQQMGHFEKRIAVRPTGGAEPLYLTMKGVVVETVTDYTGDYPLTVGELRTDRDSILFGDVNHGETATRRIHVFNPTSETAEPQVMHLPSYIQARVSPSAIPSGTGGTITLTLDTRLMRDYGLHETSVYLGLRPGDKVAADKALPVRALLLPDFRKSDLSRAPRLSLSQSVVTLPLAEGKKRVSAEITLSNTGLSTLEIMSIGLTTPGITLSLSTRQIAPGATARLKVTGERSQLRKMHGPASVLIVTNDPENAKVDIEVRKN